MSNEREIRVCKECPFFRVDKYSEHQKNPSYFCLDDGVRYFIETPNGPPFHTRLKTCRLPIKLIPV